MKNSSTHTIAELCSDNHKE